MRVYNFAAGPAALPGEVLTRAASELSDWRGLGMSVLEVSHRSADFVEVADRAQSLVRSLLGVPEGYSVLFLQGGATGQFAAIPQNLAGPADRASYVNTGSWSKKAIAEAKAQLAGVDVVADEAASSYSTVPAADAVRASEGSRYLHYTPNETIGGVEFGYVPDVDVPLVADFSSTIMSRPIDVSRFGVIYAGAQKNLGPAGLVLVVVRDDLLGSPRPGTPSVWDWTQQAGADSMLNTPPTFGLYLLGLVLEWIEGRGGLTALEQQNRAKAELLYGAIDASPFYSNPVAVDARSWMNVPFLLADDALDGAFKKEAAAAGLANLGGHRSVGGMRASIYNAMPLDGVQALVDFMAEFERTHA